MSRRRGCGIKAVPNRHRRPEPKLLFENGETRAGIHSAERARTEVGRSSYVGAWLPRPPAAGAVSWGVLRQCRRPSRIDRSRGIIRPRRARLGMVGRVLRICHVIVSTSIEGSDLTVGMRPIVQLEIGGTPARQMTSRAVSCLVPHVIHSAAISPVSWRLYPGRSVKPEPRNINDSGYSHVRRFKLQAQKFLARPSSCSAWPPLSKAGGTIM